MDGEDRTLWEQFLDNHDDVRYVDDLNILRSALIRIGNHIGADSRYFRSEGFRGGDASALPPYPHLLKGATTPLRLYCLRYSVSVVILYSGGVKMAKTAQECDNVRPHFFKANQLSKSIQDAVKEGELREGSPGVLLFGNDFKLILR